MSNLPVSFSIASVPNAAAAGNKLNWPNTKPTGKSRRRTGRIGTRNQSLWAISICRNYQTAGVGFALKNLRLTYRVQSKAGRLEAIFFIRNFKTQESSQLVLTMCIETGSHLDNNTE